MRCPACEHSNPVGSRYCNRCGAELGTARSAPQDSPRRYTPRHLADKILTTRSALEGERKQVTVLFADVKGSLDLAAQLDPEEWHRIMDRFFQILASGVHRFEGTVNQYTGDGIMALFGAPIAHEDHARRACYAALHLTDELRRYADELRLHQELNFSVRMGLNSGEVVVGRIGDDLRMDYTAQGQTVGLAARMEHLAEPGKVFLTRHTAELVKGFFELRDLGKASVRGAEEPVRIYELEGVGQLRTRLDVSRSRGFSRFVGREDEMAQLEVALEHAIDSEGGVVALVGEPGVGKSRVGFEFLERCRERGLLLYRGHALSHTRSVPFLPVLELMRDYFGISEQDGDETARDKIAGRAVRLDESSTDALPLLFDFLGVPDPSRPAPLTDLAARESRLFEVVSRLLQARSAREPTVLMIDDLHWIDSGSERFIGHLVDSLPQTRTLLLLITRPEYRAPWAGRPYYRELSLAPLAPAATAELLAELLGADPSVRKLPDLIEQRTGGNPFFIEEVVQALVDSGALVGPRGAHRLALPLEELRVPDSVQALLAARIDRLPEAEKRLLQTASVIGKQFGEALLETVAELPRLELAVLLQRLLAGEFIYEEALYPEPEYSFKHPLTQEVTYGTQLRAGRTRTHAAVARAIEAADPAKTDEQSALIAHHWEAAGEALLAARSHRRAAEWAGVRHPAEALDHWQRVPELLRTLPESAETNALGVEAYVRILLLGLRLGMSEEEAAEIFDEGRVLASRADDPHLLAGLLYRYGALRGTEGAIEEALEFSRQVLNLGVRTRDPALLWAARVGVAHWSHYLGRLREGLLVIDRALADAPDDLDVGTEFLGYRPIIGLRMYRGMHLSLMGRLEEADAWLQRALRSAEDAGEVELPGWVRLHQGKLAYYRGDADLALAHGRAGLEAAERTGSGFGAVQAYHALGCAHLLRQEWTEVIDMSRTGLELARRTRTGLFLEAELLVHLAEGQLGSGEWALARSSVREAVAVARRRGTRVAESMALLVEARLLTRTRAGSARGRVLGALRAAQSLIDHTGARTLEPFVHLERANLAHATGDRGTRQRELRIARRVFAEMGATTRSARLEEELREL